MNECKPLISGNVDLLLQELNAFNQLDEKALEQVDAEIALRAAKNLTQNFNEAEDPYVLNSQRQRLLDRCRFQAGAYTRPRFSST